MGGLKGGSRFAAVAFAAAVMLGVAAEGRASEEGDDYSPEYTRCMEASGGVTQSMVECMTEEAERQDKRLNANYKAAMKVLSPERGNGLKEVQRAWIKFRDAACGWEAGGEGTIARVNANSCFLSMTAERADQLNVIAGMN